MFILKWQNQTFKAFISFSIKGFFKQEQESFFPHKLHVHSIEYPHYRMIRFHTSDEISTPALFRRMQLSNYVMQLLTAFWRPVLKIQQQRRKLWIWTFWLTYLDIWNMFWQNLSMLKLAVFRQPLITTKTHPAKWTAEHL